MFKKMKERVSTMTTESLESARTRVQGLNSQASQYIDHLVNSNQNSSKEDSDTSSVKSEVMPTPKGADQRTADLLQLDEEATDAQSLERAGEASLDQFSLVELDEPSPAHTASSPNPGQLLGDSRSTASENESFLSMTPVMSPSNHFVPQSEIESEYESETHGHYPSLETVTKEQLFELCVKLKDRGRKYRDRWSQVVRGYRQMNEENEKMKRVLTDTQDKCLRRINEMKEQSELEQQAKRHLEENLRVVIEEKDEKIKVLQTKITLLNEGESADLMDLKETDEDRKQLNEKVERLETLLQRCKDSLKTNRDKLNALNKENEELLEFRDKYQEVSCELESLKKSQEDSSLSFAEAKQKLHEEIEAKSIVVRELEDQMKKKRQEMSAVENELKSKTARVTELEDRIDGIERTAEEDKQNLLQELSRGKAAAIHLIRDETEKKVSTLDEEWKQKYELLENENKELKQKISETESNEIKKQIEETNEVNNALKDEIQECQMKLNQTIEELNRAQESRQEEKNNLEKLLSDSEKKSSEHLSEIQRLSERSAHLEELEQQLQKNESLLKSAEEKTEDARHELESLRNQLEDRVQAIDQLREEKKRSDEELNNRISSLEEMLKQSQELVNTEESDLKSRLSEVQSELIVQKQRADELETKVKAKDNEVENLIQKCSTLESTIAERNGVVEELKNNLKSYELKCQEMDQLKSELDAMSNVIGERDNRVKELEESIGVLQSSANELDKCREELSRYRDREAELTSAQEVIGAEKNNLQTLLADSQKRCTELEVEVQRLASASDQMSQLAEERKQQIEAKVYELDQKVKTEEEMMQRLVTLEDQLRQTQDSQNLEENELKNRLNSLQSEVIALRQREEELVVSVGEKDSAVTRLEEVVKQLSDEKITADEEWTKKFNDKDNQLQEVIRISDKLSSDLKDYHEKVSLIGQLEKDVIAFKATIEDLEVMIKDKDQSIESLTSKANEVDNCREQLNKLKTIETDLKKVQKIRVKEKKNFEKQLADSLKKYSELEQQLQKNESTVKSIEKERDDSRLELESMRDQLKAKEMTINELSEEKTRIEEQLNQKSNQSDERLNQMSESIESERSEFKNRLNDLQKESIAHKERAQELDRQLSEKDNELIQLRQRCEQLEANSNDNTNAIESLTSDMKTYQDKCAHYETELDNKTGIISQLEKQIHTRDEDIKRLERSLATEGVDFKSEIQKLTDQLEAYREVENQLRDVQRVNEELKSSLSERSVEHNNELEALRSQMKQMTEQNEAIVDKLYKQLDIREKQLDEREMAEEAIHHSAAQELVDRKAEVSRLTQRLQEVSEEKLSLQAKVEELSAQLEQLSERTTAATDAAEKADTSDKSQELIDRIVALETKLRENDLEYEERVEKLHQNEDKLHFDFKKQISSLESELNDKNSALEEVHEYYQQRLKDKDNELKCLHSEFGSETVNEHTYQVKAMQNSLLQYQEENVRLKELLNIRRFAETNDQNNSPLLSGVHLPEPTEYEYLRNILFEFMVGREPVTLAKVIAAVMRFSSDQTDQIIKKQESIQTSAPLVRQFKPN